jgi:hypothetical protein
VPSIAYGPLLCSSKILLPTFQLDGLLSKCLFLIILVLFVEKIFNNTARETTHNAKSKQNKFRKVKRKWQKKLITYVGQVI